MIDKSITIEELVEIFPKSIKLLSEFGIRCLVCGEPSWGTLESAAKEKGIDDLKIDQIINEINVEYKKLKT